MRLTNTNYRSILSKILLLPSFAFALNLLGYVGFGTSILARAIIPNSYEHTQDSIQDEHLLAQTADCVDYLECRFISCDRTDSEVICKMLLTAKQDTDIRIFTSSSAFDRFGDEYSVENIKFGNTDNGKYNYVRKKILQGIPVKLEITFKDIPIEIKYLNALNINLRKQNIVFRDIQIN